MSVRRPRRSAQKKRSRTATWYRQPELLDALVLGTWSLALFRYWFTGQLFLLLHPNYMWLPNGSAFVLLAMAGFKLMQFKRRAGRISASSHSTLLPPRFSSLVLLAIAVISLLYTPQAFASDKAIQRGISDSLTLTRSQPQRFLRQTASEDRTVIDWIRTLNVYPEPDAYTGQKVKLSGFVIHPPDWPEEYLMVSRFVLTCCAADAYPVGIPVQLAVSRQAYAADGWLEIEGKMITATINAQLTTGM